MPCGDGAGDSLLQGANIGNRLIRINRKDCFADSSSERKRFARSSNDHAPVPSEYLRQVHASVRFPFKSIMPDAADNAYDFPRVAAESNAFSDGIFAGKHLFSLSFIEDANA